MGERGFGNQCEPVSLHEWHIGPSVTDQRFQMLILRLHFIRRIKVVDGHEPALGQGPRRLANRTLHLKPVCQIKTEAKEHQPDRPIRNRHLARKALKIPDSRPEKLLALLDCLGARIDSDPIQVEGPRNSINPIAPRGANFGNRQSKILKPPPPAMLIISNSTRETTCSKGLDARFLRNHESPSPDRNKSP